MLNNVFYILAALVLLAWLFGVPASGTGFLVAKAILVIAAIMVLIQLTTNRKLSP